MNSLLVWLIPPCTGALIGFVTNVVAIRMLFRPLTEKRICGLRLPFTPGILPRQRHKLADSIGAMVERELFTPEILKARLRQEDVRESLYQTVVRCTDRILTAPMEAHGNTARFLGPLFGNIVHSPAFELLFDRVFAALAGGKRSVRELLGPEYGDRVEKNTERFIRDRISRAIPSITGQILLAAEAAFPEAAASFIRFLHEPAVHGELEVQGRIFLNSAVLKLNVFQRFFISAGQYDKTLNERMPEIIDDLIRQLEEVFRDQHMRRMFLGLLGEALPRILSSGDTYERLVRYMSDKVRSSLDKPVGELLRSLTRDDIRTLGRKALGYLKNNGPELDSVLEGFFERCRGISLGELLAMDIEKKKNLDSFLNDRLLELADEQTAAVLDSINVRTLVSDRIDSLDMIRVEGIILDVMAHQLKWINVFGGILGAFIGIFHSAFTWVMGLF
jgi:uncharacterized membrane protein YheB (UPF0754 family)